MLEVVIPVVKLLYPGMEYNDNFGKNLRLGISLEAHSN
jgi:hypothetical protein